MMNSLGKKNKNIIVLSIVIFLIIISYIFMNSQEINGLLYRGDSCIDNGMFCSIESGETVTQNFVCDKSTFQGVEIYFGKIDNFNGKVEILIGKNNSNIKSWSFCSNQIKSNSFLTLALEESIKNSENDNYSLTIINDSDMALDMPLCENENQMITLITDSELQNGILNIRTIYRYWNKIKLVVLLIVISVIGLLLTLFCINKSYSFETTYLIIGAFLGLLYLGSLPVFRAPDEINHYMRIYEITEGNIVSAHIPETGVGGNYLPENLIPTDLCDARKIDYYKVWYNRNEEMNPDVLTEYTYGNTSLYSPIVYIPQILGIFLGKFFTMKSVYLVYWGRLFSFLYCYILMYFIIKNAKVRKNVVFLVSFFPMFISQIVSLSADALTIVSIFALTTYVVYLNAMPPSSKIKRKELVLLFLLTILVSMSKIVYLPVCFIILLIQNNRFESRKESILYKVGMLSIITVLNLIWLSISTGFLVEFNEGVNSKEQVLYILKHPIRYLSTCLNTLILLAQDWLEEMVGSKLGWAMDIEVPRILILGLLITLFLFLILSDYKEEYKIQKTERILLFIIGLGTIALIFTSLYVQWTPVANMLVNGIQGRYFLPLISVFLLLASNRKYAVKFNYNYLLLELYFVNMIAIIKQTFYYFS